MISFNFDLEIFCDIYYCGKFGDLIDSQIARVFDHDLTKELDQLEIDRSQSFCLLLSVCHNPALVEWFCLMLAFTHKQERDNIS